MHKIVVLDGAVLNPGDLSWTPLEALGSLTVYDRTPGEMILSHIGDADIVLTNKTPLTAETLAAAPKVKFIGALGTGFNSIAIGAAKSLGVAVANVPSYSTHDVAQFTMALLLEVCHRIGDHSRGVQAGEWARSRDFCYWDSPQMELFGKTFGVIGMGRIGQAAAKLAEAFGMKVLYYSRHEKELPFPAEFVDLDTLLRESDVVSLHCPLTPQNRGLIGREKIGKMKDGAILLNTSRGSLIDEEAVADALKSGKLYAFAADVLPQEPMRADSPFLGLDNAILTPHIAWASRAARKRLLDVTVSNIAAFLEGKVQNRVE